MNHQEFFERVQDRFFGQDLQQIAKAYWFAKRIHHGESRNNGERYFEHCRRVTCKVLEWDGVDANVITTALLHDCEEEGFIPRGILENLFREEIVHAVETLSKVVITYDELTGEVKEKIRTSDGEYFQRIQDAPPGIRRIKICDRLDNLSTMGVWDDERQRRYIIETETYVLPIARMTDRGLMQTIEEELFKHHSRPWIYTYKCFECNKEPVAQFTLWFQNKFLKYSNFPAKFTMVAPFEGVTDLRDLLESKNWQAIRGFLKERCPEVISWQYFCSKCQRFYCNKCAKKIWWIGPDDWEPPEIYEECPTCSGIPKGIPLK